MVRVKDLVAGHDRHQIFRLGQVDNVVGPAGDHMDRLDLIPGNLKLHRLASVDVPLLNQAVTGHDDEQLPLGVVPVLALGDAGAADVDGHLAAVGGMDELGKGAPVVRVHFQGILEFVGRQIGQVQGIQLLSKAAIGHFRHHQGRRLRLELLQQVHNLAQGDLVGHGDAAVASVGLQDGLYALELAVLLLAFQQVEHALHQVVDVQQFQFGAAVVDGEGFIVGHGPTEGGDGAIVLGAAVAHEVDETVDGHFGPGLLGVGEKELLPCLLAAAILAVAEASGQGGLDGAGQHDGRLVGVLFQAVQQVRGKAKVAFHEVFRILRAVDTGQVEDEVSFPAICVQFFRSGAQIVFVNLVNMQSGAGLVFAVPDVFQVVAQGGSHHALGTCYQNVHFFTSVCTAVQSGTSAPSGTAALLQTVTLLPMRAQRPTAAPVRTTELV